ncbi:MAG: hypothetical protein IPN48_16285 [Sphingomonadales bacterium]|nr:hypothetical protein [Sphingomonadales bacterium]
MTALALARRRRCILGAFGNQPSFKMGEKNVTISAAIPANVKAEAAAVAAAHGMSLAALLRELLARVAARDAETLAWLDEARR